MKHPHICPGCGHPHAPKAPCRLDLVEEIARLVAQGYATAKVAEAPHAS